MCVVMKAKEPLIISFGLLKSKVIAVINFVWMIIFLFQSAVDFSHLRLVE